MGPESVKRLLYILASIFFFSTALAVGTTAASNGLELESIEVIAGDDKPEQVVFKFNGSHTPKSFRLNGDNPRLVFDFYGVKYLSDINRIDDVGGNIVAGIRVGRHNEPPKTRVVVDIQKDSPYLHEQTFNVSNNSLVVTFTPDIAQISAQQEPTVQPQRIEVDSFKVVHSDSEAKPESEPPAPPLPPAPAPPVAQQSDTSGSAQPEQAAVAEQPAVKDDTAAAEKAAAEEGTAQPQRIEVDSTKVVHSGSQTEPKSEQPATDETAVTQDQEEEVDIAASPQEEAEEPSASSPAAEPDTPPTPPVQPSEPSGTDQQTQVARPEQPPEPLSTDEADIVPVLLDVAFEKSINESETVLFRLNHFYPPLVFGIEKGEPRVVCDFFDAEIADQIPPVIEAGGQFIDRIMVTNESDPDKVRVELVLMPNRNYDLQQLFFKEDNLFVVIVKELQEDSAAAN